MPRFTLSGGRMPYGAWFKDGHGAFDLEARSPAKYEPKRCVNLPLMLAILTCIYYFAVRESAECGPGRSDMPPQ